MASVQVQELPLRVPPPIPRRQGPSRFLALLGASLLVLSLVVKPPVHAGLALAGFLLWLLWAARLLLSGQVGRQRPVFQGALEAATARFFLARQAPAPAPEPAAAPPV
ncbi:unnamed protein product [Urochloa decumbens]|uniref:Uncharacterized protein n=1 Tax=Urochloa decumbens TaxID=240449 RepID=A0ABC8XSH2_9POAL